VTIFLLENHRKLLRSVRYKNSGYTRKHADIGANSTE
jgi:hypothetical protein